MKLVSLPILNNLKINFKQNAIHTTHLPTSVLSQDVFEKKDVKMQAINTANLSFSDEEILKLYDETFNTFVEDNPIVKELGFKKPELTFGDGDSCVASYLFFKNKIEVNKGLKEQIYAFSTYHKNGELIDCGVDIEKFLQQGYHDLKSNSAEIQIAKLSKKEKELYIKAILAHELRHWMQDWILASAKGCEKALNFEIDFVRRGIETHEELLKALLSETSSSLDRINETKAKISELKNNLEFLKSFENNKKIDENLQIKYSDFENKNRYWSLQEHFLPAKLRYNNSDKIEYSSSPIEIDAYNYQFVFLMNEAHKMNLNTGTKNLEAMLLPVIVKGSNRLSEMTQNNYPPLFES